MIDKQVRDVVNLMIYSGLFIGICAACTTALTMELLQEPDLPYHYALFIGVTTAALYCGHRVIGLRKMAHVKTTERFAVIRKYSAHIWLYFFLWVILSGFLGVYMEDLPLLLWLVPGGAIGLGYVVPFLSGWKRLRDLGWTKILMIGWSWAWLTAFVPAFYLGHQPLAIAGIIALERFLFIVAITIPFDVRDLIVDLSVGLVTLPAKLGPQKTTWLVVMLCSGILAMDYFLGRHFHNTAYFFASCITSAGVLLVNLFSRKTQDDYFFSGLTDGLMILSLWFYIILK